MKGGERSWRGAVGVWCSGCSGEVLLCCMVVQVGLEAVLVDGG